MYWTDRCLPWCLVVVLSILASFAGLAVSAMDTFATSQPPSLKAQEADTEERPTVGVLFLVDESGGVNGHCQVSDEHVLIVDEEEGKRYQIIRFFMALLGSVYDNQYGDLSRQSKPAVQVGVSQFADDYERVYGFTLAEDLFSDPFTLERRDIALNACRTDYPTALARASQDLIELDVDHRVLVIITDGSFRGFELATDATEDEHTEIRNEVAEAFRDNIQVQDIQTFVYILGYKSVCYDSLDCGLASEEYEIRRGDMDRWGEWSNSSEVVDTGYFTLLDANGGEADTIQSILSVGLTLTSTVGSLPPGGQVLEGRTTPGDSEAGFQQSFNLPSSLQRQNINIIPFQPVNVPDMFSLCEPPENENQPPVCNASLASRPRLGVEVLGDHWWRYEREIEPIRIPYECVRQEWDLEYKRDGAIFFWYNSWNRTFEDAGILSLEAPERLVVNDSTRLPISATLDLSRMPDLWHNSCYKVFFTADLSDEMPELESEGIPIATSRFNYAFDLPDLVCPSRMITVSVAIQATDSHVDQLPVTEQLELYFRPELEESEVVTYSYTIPFSQGMSTHVITVPIRYAACNNDFAPRFSFASSSDDLVPRSGCPDNADLTPHLDNCSNRYEMSTNVRGDTIDYILTLKAGPKGTTYASCGYDTINVEMDSNQYSVRYSSENTDGSPVKWIMMIAGVLIVAIAVVLVLRK